MEGGRLSLGGEGSVCKRLKGEKGESEIRESLVLFCKHPTKDPGNDNFFFGQGRAAGLLGRVKFRFRVFCVSLLIFQNCPPVKVLRRLVFIGEMLLGFSTWSLNFFLFVNFDFSYLFCIF